MRKLKRILLPLVIALALIVTVQVVLAAVWGTNHLNLSRATTNAAYPAVAVSSDGQNIGFVWSQGIPGTTAARGPVYLKAASDGYTISVRTAVDFANSSTNQSLTPDVASDPQNDDYMYVVWKNIEDNDTTVYVKRCLTTGGCTSEVSIESVLNGDVNTPRIATSKQSVGTVVHLAWQSINDGPPQTKVIKYASGYWNASGTTWTWLQGPTPGTVSGSGRWASHPAIAVSTDASGNGTNVHVAWADAVVENDVNASIRYRHRPLNSNGSLSGSWSTPVQSFLANSLPGVFGEDPDYPALAAFEGTVMLLWDEQWNNGIVGSPGTTLVTDTYYLAYAVSANHGTGFATDVLRDGSSNVVTYLSDYQRQLVGTGFTEESPAERLQVDVTAELTSTASITGLFHIVWHSNEDNTDPLEPYHDIFYNRWCGGTCGADSGWKYDDGSNETDGLKYNGPYQTQDAPFYSMSADIAAASGNKVYVVYMEGDDTADSEPSLNDTHFDVIYNGTVRLTDTTSIGDGGVYLPVIMKNAS